MGQSPNPSTPFAFGLAANYSTIDDDLPVATDFAIQGGGEVDMGGATLAAGALQNGGADMLRARGLSCAQSVFLRPRGPWRRMS
jgi:hypothetical protein